MRGRMWLLPVVSMTSFDVLRMTGYVPNDKMNTLSQTDQFMGKGVTAALETHQIDAGRAGLA